MTTLTAEAPTLSPSNALTNTALLNAMAALHRLNELGLRIARLEASPVFGAKLVLDEDSNAETLSKLESGLLCRTVNHLYVIEIRAAHVLGCQVEWTVRRRQTTDAISAEVAA